MLKTAPVNAWQRTESYSAGETIDFGCFLSQRAPVMRLQWLDSVVPNSSRTAGFLTGSMAGPLLLPPLKHEGDRGRCGYYLSSSQIPSISPSAKMKRRRARQSGKEEKNKSIHISFIWKGKCFCAVEIDASAPMLPGVCTHCSSNLFFCTVIQCCPSICTHKHPSCKRLPRSPSIAPSVFLRAPARSTAHNCFLHIRYANESLWQLA